MSVISGFSRTRLLFVMVGAVGASALSVGPVAAQTEIGHTGTVGFHTLRDGVKPGAKCTWTERDGAYFWTGELTHIDVRPPRMRASSGMQLVGWRFIVQRRAWNEGYGPWKNKYFSPTQWDTTSTTSDASFAWMGVDVNVPTSDPDEIPFYQYRVRVKMFWKNGSGDVVGTATHEIDWYRKVEQSTYNEDTDCDSWYAWQL